ncbi:MAG: hypothetical protein JNL84_08965 [Candidatus Accumulibacter sp.]|nr:hypothetical protein [Accumulibacter sp.]
MPYPLPLSAGGGLGAPLSTFFTSIGNLGGKAGITNCIEETFISGRDLAYEYRSHSPRAESRIFNAFSKRGEGT